MNPNYPLVAERAGHRCKYCHAPEVIFNIPFEVDHIVPQAKGGRDEPSNSALACRACNLRKSDTVDGLDPVTNARVLLFNPREQKWQDHFAVSSQPAFRLEGKTPVGRVTVEQMRMNAPLQLEARA